jgi:hypothetical protein
MRRRELFFGIAIPGKTAATAGEDSEVPARSAS